MHNQGIISQYQDQRGVSRLRYLTLLSDVDPGEAGEQLEGGETGVEVALPGGDEAVADQVGGSDEESVCRV